MHRTLGSSNLLSCPKLYTVKYLFSDIELRWFGITALLTVLIIIAYVVLHCIWSGTEAVYLTKEQLTAANTILAQDTSDTAEDSVRAQFQMYMHRILDNHDGESTDIVESIDDQLKPLELYSTRQLPAILPTYPFYITSPFWLLGGWVFFELIFWSLFGVAANVIYRASEAMCEGTFDEQKIPIHLAKLIYAPLSTIVIFLSIEVFSQNGSITLDDLTSSTIVLAFMLGFFSGRTVELLRRLKNVILPLGAGEEEHAARRQKGLVNQFGTILGNLQFGTNASSVPNFDYSKIDIRLYSATDIYFQRSATAAVDGKFSFPEVPVGQYELRAMTSLDDKAYLATDIVDLTEEGVEISLSLMPYSDVAYNMIVK